MTIHSLMIDYLGGDLGETCDLDHYPTLFEE